MVMLIALGSFVRSLDAIWTDESGQKTNGLSISGGGIGWVHRENDGQFLAPVPTRFSIGLGLRGQDPPSHAVLPGYERYRGIPGLRGYQVWLPLWPICVVLAACMIVSARKWLSADRIRAAQQ
jgi:hypothetical protein